MGAVVWFFTVVISIAVTVYEIAKFIYDWLIEPLIYIRDAIEDVQEIVRGVIDTIRGKIDYILELSGADVLLDLAHSVAEFLGLAEGIADKSFTSIVLAFGGVYEAIAGTARDIITIMSQALSPVFDRLAILQDDIKTITEFKLKKLTDGYNDLTKEIRAMPEKLMADVKAEIDAESQRIRDGFAGELAVVNVKLTGAIALSEDLKHFSEMFLKAMET